MAQENTVYGELFSAIYNESWDIWTPKVWPFLRRTVRRLAPHARTWLDLCCGNGSLLRHVQNAGFSATGLDSSLYQLRCARKNAPKAKFVRGDVRDLNLGRTYDVVTCMFDSLNYLTAKRDVFRLFTRVRQHLEKKGLFIFDANTYAGLQEQWKETRVLREPHYTLVAESSFESRRGLGRCRITGFIKKGHLYRKFEEEHVERGYEPYEIESLLRRAAFRYTKYDGYALSKPTDASWRLMYVCRVSDV